MARGRLSNAVAWINSEPWRPVPTAGLIFAFAFAITILYFAFFGEGWVPLMVSRWGLLQYDAPLATAVRGLGCLAIAYALCFLWQRGH